MKAATVSMALSRWAVCLLSFGAVALPVMADTSACPDSAQHYWKAFRQSVLRGDHVAVTQATRFPFEVRGTLDESDRRLIDQKDFASLLPALLKADPGLFPQPSTMRSLLKASSRLKPSACNVQGDQLRVGVWVFERTPEGWRFVRGYLDQ